MSQSTTFYSLSPEIYASFRTDEAGNLNLMEISEQWVTLQGTSFGIQFLLEKNQKGSAIATIRQIFDPCQFPNAYRDEMIELGVIEPPAVEAFAKILDAVTSNTLLLSYDPEELNRQGIYPGTWIWESDESQAHTEKHLLGDFNVMKNFFALAASNRHFVVSVTG